MNLIEIIGFVGNDPEERMTPSGRKVVSFRIADNMRTGEREETLWWRISCWGDQFDRLMPHIKKGSMLIVHGEMRKRPETYQDREGHTQVSLELTATQIRFAPGGRERTQGSPNAESSAATPAPYSHANAPAMSGASSPASVPGGFKPGRGNDEFSEENLPF